MSKSSNGEINQTKCWIATEGHIWMADYFDTLPQRVRQRLRQSPFNLCPACLVTKFMPEVRRRHRQYSHEAAPLAAIEIMELQVSRAAGGVR
jgi:hypothetical protein